MSWERITPLLPRAPSSAAPGDRVDDLVAADLVDRAVLLLVEQAVELAEHRRSVSAMLSPVSPSATGKTLRSLTSWRRASSWASPAATTARKRVRLVSAATAGRGARPP
jgi:hypothetical protein